MTDGVGGGRVREDMTGSWREQRCDGELEEENGQRCDNEAELGKTVAHSP
jgi:hypothetical protein